MSRKDREASLCMACSVLPAPQPVWVGEREGRERTFQSDLSSFDPGGGKLKRQTETFLYSPTPWLTPSPVLPLRSDGQGACQVG